MKTLFYNTRFLILLLIIYPLLFIWQGIDMTDQGYVLTNYQRIFDYPSTTLDQLTLLLWLSMFIGGLWNLLFSSLGVIGFKVAYVLTLYATMIFAYYTLKDYFEKKQLLFTLLLTQMFIIKAVGQWIHYNHLTALFFVASGYLLMNGFKKQNHIFVFFAALTLGINTFVRLPNVIGFSLILVIFFYGHLNQFSKGQYIRLALHFISGYASGLIVIFVIMHYLGHLDIFLTAIKNISSRLSDDTDVHSARLLTDLLKRDPLMMVVYSIFAIGAIFTASKLVSNIKKTSVQYVFIAVLTGIAYCILSYKESWKWVYSGIICFILVCYFVYGNWKAPEAKSLVLLSIILLFSVAFGSGNGFRNTNYGMWLSMPMALLFLLNLEPGRLFKFKFTRAQINCAQKLVFSTVIISTLIIAIQYTYRDSNRRWTLRYPIDHPRLRGILTTKERADTLQDLLKELSNHVQEGDDLFAYEGTQLVYFLTNTKPYLDHSSPMLYLPEEFESSLKKSQKEKAGLPIVVRAKSNTKNLNWPEGAEVGLEMDDRIIGCRRVAQTFLNERRYKLLWENTFFQILGPPDPEI